MTQLAADNEGIKGPLAGLGMIDPLTVYDAEKMYVGGLMAVDYTDEAHMAADTQGLKVVGLCSENVDNTDDGEEVAAPLRGIYRLENSSSYPVPRSAVGEICYVEDDNTVAGYSTNFVPAGLVHDVDDDGVWVDMRPEALAYAWRNKPSDRVEKGANYTVTAAIAFEGRTYFHSTKSDGAMEITLPSAVAGMRVGVQRGEAGAGNDVTIQAATGDKIEASDGFCAAGKQIDNTVDAVSGILFLRAATDTEWVIDNPVPVDVGSWVKNDT